MWADIDASELSQGYVKNARRAVRTTHATGPQPDQHQLSTSTNISLGSHIIVSLSYQQLKPYHHHGSSSTAAAALQVEELECIAQNTERKQRKSTAVQRRVDDAASIECGVQREDHGEVRSWSEETSLEERILDLRDEQRRAIATEHECDNQRPLERRRGDEERHKDNSEAREA